MRYMLILTNGQRFLTDFNVDAPAIQGKPAIEVVRCDEDGIALHSGTLSIYANPDHIVFVQDLEP